MPRIINGKHRARAISPRIPTINGKSRIKAIISPKILTINGKGRIRAIISLKILTRLESICSKGETGV